jgi:hypothetical protein
LEQNKGPRNESTQLHPSHFWQKLPKPYDGEINK